MNPVEPRSRETKKEVWKFRLSKIIEDHKGEKITMEKICFWLGYNPEFKKDYQKVYFWINYFRQKGKEMWKLIESVNKNGKEILKEEAYQNFLNFLKKNRIPFLYYNPEEHRYFIPPEYDTKENLDQISVTKKAIALINKLREMQDFGETLQLTGKKAENVSSLMEDLFTEYLVDDIIEESEEGKFHTRKKED